MMTAATQRNAAPAPKPAAAPQQQQAPKPDPHVTAGRPVLENALNRYTEYVPFQASEPIKLSVGLVLEHLCTPTKSGKRCTASQAMRFIMLCKSRKLNPWEGDAYIVGYDGKDGPTFSLITAHQAYLKRAETHPDYNGMESGVIVRRGVGPAAQTVQYEGDYVEPGDVLVGGWARVHSRKKSVPCYRRLSLSAFQKQFGVWSSNPAGMIVKCAEADALRSSYPNVFGGMASPAQQLDAAEVAEIIPTWGDAQPSQEAESHPEPPPFDRAGCIRSISQQNSEAIKAGLLRVESFPAMLAEYEAVKIDELTDEQLQQVEQQVAAVFRTTEPANGQMFPDGAGDPSEAMRERR